MKKRTSSDNRQQIDAAIAIGDIEFFKTTTLSPKNHCYALEKSIEKHQQDLYEFLKTHKKDLSSEILVASCRFKNDTVLNDVLLNHSFVFGQRLINRTIEMCLKDKNTSAIKILCHHFYSNPQSLPDKEMLTAYAALAVYHENIEALRAFGAVGDLSHCAYDACSTLLRLDRFTDEQKTQFMGVLLPFCDDKDCSALLMFNNAELLPENVLDRLLKKSCPDHNALILRALLSNPYSHDCSLVLLKDIFQKTNFDQSILYVAGDNIVDYVVERKDDELLELIYGFIPPKHIDQTLKQLVFSDWSDPLWQHIKTKRTSELEKDILSSSVTNKVSSRPTKKI